MAPPRKFDHDECRALHATGEWTQVALAKKYGVTPEAIYWIVRPEARARHVAYHKRWRTLTCEDCGGPCGPNPYNPSARLDRVVCRRCAATRASEEHLLSRLDDNGDILCSRCGRHRPLERYSFATKNGVPRSECRDCETERRRDYRARFPEIEAAATERARLRRVAKREAARDSLRRSPNGEPVPVGH